MDLVNSMLDMLSFVENVNDAVMKLKITRKTVKEMFELIQKVSDFALKLIGTCGLKGEYVYFTGVCIM